MIGSDPIFSVSEFVAVFNQSLEITYPAVGIVGELANLRVSRNQWVYFDLKDDEAQVKFFGTVRQLPGPLEDGLSLEVFGRPRLHPRYGFSVVVESIRVVGKGSIKKAQDLLARKLETEGLFDGKRKRLLPHAPSRIGLITALDSAACADFKKIIDVRWPALEVVAVDVLVQGIDSPRHIINAMKKLNELPNPPEIIVMIRGGGSPEDLAGFSEESVVRAVAASRVPTLVAIGHETDISLSELAADSRASTPSNAAELLVPDRKSENQLLDLNYKKIQSSLNQLLKTTENNLSDMQKMLDGAFVNIFDAHVRQLESLSQLVKILDPGAPLRRGFALVRQKNNTIVRSIKNVNLGDQLTISLRDGTIESKVSTKKSI